MADPRSKPKPKKAPAKSIAANPPREGKGQAAATAKAK